MRVMSVAMSVTLAAFFCVVSAPTLAKGSQQKAARCAEAPEGAGFDPSSAESMQTALAKAPPIFRVLDKGSQAELSKLLASRPRLNVCHLGMSPLILAASMGNADTVAMLLDAGASIDTPRDALGGTALLVAAGFSRFEVAQLLMSRGADVRAVTDGGTSVLHELAIAVPPADEAARSQQLSVAREVLRRGGAVDGTSGPHRTTPLMMAAVSGNQQLVGLLLQQGADPRLTNTKGESALSFARRKKNEDIVRLLEDAAARAAR